MGSHSDGYVEQELLTTVVTCKGDLSDPQFNAKFARFLHQLQKLLLNDPSQYLGVVKVEPWNSVRVTFTVPKEAALRLRLLAQQGDTTLSQLGILSVQLEGDQAISLKIAGPGSGESQEIVLRTSTANEVSQVAPLESDVTAATETTHQMMISDNSSDGLPDISQDNASLFQTVAQALSNSTVYQQAFKTQNKVAGDFQQPLAPPTLNSAPPPPLEPSKAYQQQGPFPFASMTHAAQAIHNREKQQQQQQQQQNHQFAAPPPPYPVSQKMPPPPAPQQPASPINVALSSPLLVNLLQNDGLPNSNKLSADSKGKNSVANSHKPPPNTVKRRLPLDSLADSQLGRVQQQHPVSNMVTKSLDMEQPQQQQPQQQQQQMTSRLPMFNNINAAKAFPAQNKVPVGQKFRLVNVTQQQQFSQQTQIMRQQQQQQQKVALLQQQQQLQQLTGNGNFKNKFQQQQLQPQQQQQPQSQQQQQRLNHVYQPSTLNSLGDYGNNSAQKQQQEMLNQAQVMRNIDDVTIASIEQIIKSSDSRTQQLFRTLQHNIKTKNLDSQSLKTLEQLQKLRNGDQQQQQQLQQQQQMMDNQQQRQMKMAEIQARNAAAALQLRSQQQQAMKSQQNSKDESAILQHLREGGGGQQNPQQVAKGGKALVEQPRQNFQSNQNTTIGNPSVGKKIPASPNRVEPLTPTSPLKTAAASPTSSKLPPYVDKMLDRKEFLINPLTGEMEPAALESPVDKSPVKGGDVYEFSKEEKSTPDQADGSKQEKEKHVKLLVKFGSNEPVVSVVHSPPTPPPVPESGKKSSSSSSEVEEQPRVPPLHISLRGRNAAVVKKDNKRWTEDGPEGGQKKMVEDGVEVAAKCQETTGAKGKGRKDQDDGNQEGSPVLSTAVALPTIRSFPTQEEITSILRSVPSDTPNKMSLSCVKMNNNKRKEGGGCAGMAPTKKKEKVSEEGGSSGGNSGGNSPSAGFFTRVINETKCSLSQVKTKSKGNPVSLLKSVMKSKEARMFGASLASRNVEKKTASNACSEGQGHSNAAAKGGNGAMTVLQKRKSSADVTFSFTNVTITNAKMRSLDNQPDGGGGTSSLAHCKEGPTMAAASSMAIPSFPDVTIVKKSFGKGVGNRVFTTHDYRNEYAFEESLEDEDTGRLGRFGGSPSGGGGGGSGMAAAVDSPSMALALPAVDYGKQTFYKIEDGLVKEEAGGDSPNTMEHSNNQGEDSGIESMDALSEKSPNQGESPCRKEDKDGKESLMQGGQTNREEGGDYEGKMSQMAREDGNFNDCRGRRGGGSPDFDDVQPFRVTPALFTYSNPEKMRVDSPSPPLEDISEELLLVESGKGAEAASPSQTCGSPTSKMAGRSKRKRKDSRESAADSGEITTIDRYNNQSIGSKSLLEQLLIDIPSDTSVEIRRTGMPTRNTRSKGLSQPSPDTLSISSTSSSSSLKTPKCSPIPRISDDASSKCGSRSSSRQMSRRPRRGSESSNLSNSDESNCLTRQSKRKCFPNAESVDDQLKGKEESSFAAAYNAAASNNENIVTTTTSEDCGGKTSSRGTKRTGNFSESAGNTTRPVGKRRRGGGNNVNQQKSKENPGMVNSVSTASHLLGSVNNSEETSPTSSGTALRNNRSNTDKTNSPGKIPRRLPRNTTTTTTTPTTAVMVSNNHLVLRRRKSPQQLQQQQQEQETTCSDSVVCSSSSSSSSSSSITTTSCTLNGGFSSSGGDDDGTVDISEVAVIAEDEDAEDGVNKANSLHQNIMACLAAANNNNNNNMDDVKGNCNDHNTRGSAKMMVAATGLECGVEGGISGEETAANTRRKTRSLANTDGDSSKRRRISRDAK